MIEKAEVNKYLIPEQFGRLNYNLATEYIFNREILHGLIWI